MRNLCAFALVALAAASCGKDKSETADKGRRGLPPADQVELPTAMPGQAGGSRANPHGGNPHAGMGIAGDPHAGIDMGGDPHGGMVMGAQPTAEVDPNMFLKGDIVATAKTKKLVEPGAILFLMVKPINPVSGEIIGNTIAVDRLDLAQLPIPFELTGAHAMMMGTKFEGDVVIIARIDQDGEARTKQPGDIEGSVKAKIPADKLTLKLDTIIKTQSSM